ncbi:MAG TPA: hypothetical protein VEL82_07310 [Thermoplasmata archaeon]|nr:hypothetical protein [Thermoplasmata archaeon]
MPTEAAPAESLGDGLAASWPLLAAAAGLFVGAAVVFERAPHVGPSDFPLWGLLIALGFIAGIGATLSWFYATSATTVAPEVAAPKAELAGATRRAPAGEGGRPVPEARRADDGAAGAGAWDETLLVAPAVSPRVVRPPPALSEEEVDRALNEIDRIEEQLSRRPEPKRPRGEPNGRA